jgi:hypothetical protein
MLFRHPLGDLGISGTLGRAKFLNDIERIGALSTQIGRDSIADGTSNIADRT